MFPEPDSDALPPMAGSGCPECGGIIRAFHHNWRVGNLGRTERRGWAAECRAVSKCQTSRKGVIGYGEKRADAIAAFREKVIQNVKGMASARCGLNELDG